MTTWMHTIRTAVIVFPVLAAVITLPFLIYQYRRYGSIPWIRTVCVYLFTFYLEAAYLLVILPLPSRSAVAQLTTPTMNLTLFSNLDDLKSIEELRLITNDAGMRRYLVSILKGLAKWPGIEAVFNVVLLFPFGVFLHYYCRRGIVRTTLESFLLSLFFELTQLSGLYGIYPRAYRLFDVNDLFCNTLGGMLGWLLTGLFTWFLPSREEIDRKAYASADIVTYTRRASALIIDRSIVIVCMTALSLLVPKIPGVSYLTGKLTTFLPLLADDPIQAAIRILVIVLIFTLVPYISGGYTIGKALLRIRLVHGKKRALLDGEGFVHAADKTSVRPGFLRLFLRALLEHGWVLGIASVPGALLQLASASGSTPSLAAARLPAFLRNGSSRIEILISGITLAVLVADLLIGKLVTGRRVLLYERLSGVTNEADTVVVRRDLTGRPKYPDRRNRTSRSGRNR